MNHQASPSRRLLVLLAIGLAVATPRSAQAQTGDLMGGRSVPPASYFIRFSSLYEGEYNDALEGFQDELRGGIKTPQSRWIDSICYYTMVGESYYHLGQYADALDSYTAALKLYTVFPDWMIRVQFPNTIQADRSVRAIPWGLSKRTATKGNFPSAMIIEMGRLNNDEIIKKGGVVQRAMLYPVQTQEIIRCTSLAMHRRRELLGPLCPLDPLTDELVAAFSRRFGPPNHWSQTWNDVQLGMAYACAGKAAQAATLLQKSLLVAGEFDHPLTSTALLELGLLSLEAGDLAAAAAYFEEASYAAFEFPDYGILEEALRYGQVTHIVGNQKGVYPPLAKAAAWSKLRGGTELTASLLVLLAENSAFLGQPQQATSLLNDAKGVIGRRTMGGCEIGSRAQYVNALAQYQKGNTQAGDETLAAALEFQKTGSKWLYQISLTDNLYATRPDAITPRLANQLYEAVLREPTAADWGLSPLECLAVLMAPHSTSYERWFEAALARKELDHALEIADRARRHRFHSSLPLGGRLLNLRWLLEAPEQAIDKQAVLQRQDLLVRYPKYAQVAGQARQLRSTLAGGPLTVDDVAAGKELSAQFAQLGKHSQIQEAMLREIAVRREPAQTTFPPLKPVKEIQQALGKGQVALVFFASGRSLHAFLLSNEQQAYWQIASPGEVEKRTAGLLRAMGNFDANRELTLSQLTDESWKQASRDLAAAIFAGSKVNLAQGIDELIVVPDGIMWFVPFESLHIGQSKQSDALLSKTRVRYAPTLGLATPDRHGRSQSGSIGIVLGRQFPREEPEIAQAAFDQLSKDLDNAVPLKSPLPAASPLVKSLLDGLIVLDDIAGADRPFEWAPIQLDKIRSAGALGNWFSLPWGSPDYVVLPGFHTSAETGLRRSTASPGSELFLATCGLMASGTRTILLSRWRTGGHTSNELVREFAQELPYSTAAEAWQRSVEVVSQQQLAPELEPRAKSAAQGHSLDASHPFFWAGYLLIDRGAAPQAVDEQPAPAAPKQAKPVAKQ